MNPLEWYTFCTEQHDVVCNQSEFPKLLALKKNDDFSEIFIQLRRLLTIK